MRSLIILSDSRGSGLAQYLQTQQLPVGVSIIDICEGGATYERLYLRLKHVCREQDTSEAIVVLLAGICSFTTKRRGEILYERVGKTDLVKSHTDLFINPQSHRDTV